MTASLKKQIERDLDRWPERDGVVVLVGGRLVYSRPCLEPFRDPQGRPLCMGHVTAYEPS